jgi:hypothetical protein
MKLKGKWRSLGCGVYQSSDSTRVHVGGLIRQSNGIIINLLSLSENPFRYIEIMGGNRKRGIMLMSETINNRGRKE